MKYTPSFKKGTASDIDEAVEIIDNNCLLQGDNPALAGVWPSMVTMDVNKNFVATTLKEFKRLVTAGIKASPESLVCIFEVEDEADVPDEKIKLRVESMSASLIKSKKIKEEEVKHVI